MRLKTQTITITAPRDLCFEVVAAGGRRLEKRTESEWVVEFVTEAMGRKVRTVELLTLDRPRAINYRWLEGPIPDVEESILFTAIDDNRTQLTYVGRISFGKGPIGWVIARLRVKRLFERLVHEHLEQAKEVAEKRARRSRVHSRRQPPGDAG
jgi:uncharacterized protein YndB with AHSA1/START domain